MSLDEFIPNLDDLKGNFPPVEDALTVPNGLLAWGGDLSPQTLISAYSRGIFPWFSEGEPVLWWCPSPRAVIFPGQLHVSRRLARRLRSQHWSAHLNRDFESVMRHCAAPRRDQGETWISPEMMTAYARLHEMGYAHCLEVDINGCLAGGIYGITLGNIFFGESMFSVQTDGSKMAMKVLCDALVASGYRLLDCQLPSPHLQRMGAVELPLNTFQSLLPGDANLTPLPMRLPKVTPDPDRQ